MKVLVTGATSTIGLALCKELHESGDKVVACVREGSRKDLLPENVITTKCELMSPSTYLEAIHSFKPDVVYHLAWSGSVRGRDRIEQITLNVPASLEICKASISVGASFVFVGSKAEDEVVQTPYSVAKRAVGELTQMMCNRSEVTHAWCKLMTVYGPHDDPRHLIPTAIRKLTAEQSLKVTEGYELFDYIYVDDVASALSSLAFSDGVFDVGTGNSMYIIDMLTRLCGELSADKNLIQFDEYPSVGHERQQADIVPLCSRTGWKPKYTLKTGLRKTIEWGESICSR